MKDVLFGQLSLLLTQITRYEAYQIPDGLESTRESVSNQRLHADLYALVVMQSHWIYIFIWRPPSLSVLTPKKILIKGVPGISELNVCWVLLFSLGLVAKAYALMYEFVYRCHISPDFLIILFKNPSNF